LLAVDMFGVSFCAKSHIHYKVRLSCAALHPIPTIATPSIFICLQLAKLYQQSWSNIVSLASFLHPECMLALILVERGNIWSPSPCCFLFVQELTYWIQCRKIENILVITESNRKWICYTAPCGPK
jgi:hypothetical protein